MPTGTKEAFYEYLLARGYRENCLRGGAYAYIKRIESVCKWEKITWEELENEVARALRKYGEGRTRNSFAQALKRFEEFLREKKK